MHETWHRHSVVQERLAGAVQELKFKVCERDVTSTELELDWHLSAVVKDIQHGILEPYV